MTNVLEIVCKSCGARFPSGVPLRRDDVSGLRLGALEICPTCGAAADYRERDYLDPGRAPEAHRPEIGTETDGPGAPGPTAGGEPLPPSAPASIYT